MKSVARLFLRHGSHVLVIKLMQKLVITVIYSSNKQLNFKHNQHQRNKK